MAKPAWFWKTNNQLTTIVKLILKTIHNNIKHFPNIKLQGECEIMSSDRPQKHLTAKATRSGAPQWITQKLRTHNLN